MEQEIKTYEVKEQNINNNGYWKGKHLSEDHKLKLKLNHRGMLGKHHSEETKQKMRKKILSEETKRKISISHLGMKPSEETKRKLKLNHKGMLGKHHSEEARKKISTNHARPMLGKKLSEEAKRKLIESNSKEKHWNWKGDAVGYNGVHTWGRKNKPKPDVCEMCNDREPRNLANVSGEYKRDIGDYMWLCVQCHRSFDNQIKNGGTW